MIDLCTVAFNTAKLLQRQINVLFSDRKPDVWRLYVADNGSTDGTQDFLYTLCVDHPTWNGKIYEDLCSFRFGNQGYAAACNYLAGQGHADIIGLLNADVWLSTSDVLKIQKIFDEDASISILGPKQRNEQNRVTHAGIVGSNTEPKHRGWQQLDTQDVRFRDRVDCVTVSGSAYFVRRSVWDELCSCPTYKDFILNELNYESVPGAFLPTPHFFEETWCSYHARAHGHRVVYDGTVSIGHTWHASSPVGSQNMKFRESQKLFRRACDFHNIERD